MEVGVGPHILGVNHKKSCNNALSESTYHPRLNSKKGMSSNGRKQPSSFRGVPFTAPIARQPSLSDQFVLSKILIR